MRKILIALALVSFSAYSYADDKMKKDDTSKKEKSLYDRLGGNKAITKVVNDFLGFVMKDDQINSFFKKSDPKKLSALLVAQVGQATGGPEKYTGKSMADAHKGMKITEAQFNALVADLTKALDANKVPEKEKGELLGALGGMKGDIVGH
jgi:hemoglobin